MYFVLPLQNSWHLPLVFYSHKNFHIWGKSSKNSLITVGSLLNVFFKLLLNSLASEDSTWSKWPLMYIYLKCTRRVLKTLIIYCQSLNIFYPSLSSSVMLHPCQIYGFILVIINNKHYIKNLINFLKTLLEHWTVDIWGVFNFILFLVSSATA